MNKLTKDISPLTEEEKSSYETLDSSTLEFHFLRACVNKRLDIVDFIIHSSKVSLILQDMTNKAFIQACEDNNIEVIQYFFQSSNFFFLHHIYLNDEEGLKIACEYGNIEVVKYLLTSPEVNVGLTNQNMTMSNNNINGIYLNDSFKMACINGHLDILKYLLTSPDLKTHAIIDNKNCLGFNHACSFGHLDIVKYLLTSPDLKTKVNLLENKNRGLRAAGLKGHIDILHYLLTTPNIKEQVNIHYNMDDIFLNLCQYRAFSTISYLIFDYKIQRTSIIEDYIKNYDEEGIVLQMFEKKEFNEKLQQTIKENINISTVHDSTKRNKI